MSKTIFSKLQTIAVLGVIGNLKGIVTYGERFRVLRKARWKLVKLAQRLGSPYPATVYNIEKQWRVPTLSTIAKHAAALGCRPWELLKDVVTEYDEARALNEMDEAQALKAWGILITRYRDSIKRTNGKAAERERDRDVPVERYVARLESGGAPADKTLARAIRETTLKPAVRQRRIANRRRQRLSGK